MTEALTIKSTVEKILKDNPACRNSYNALFAAMLAHYGCHLDSDQQRALLEMPSPLSIDRAARKAVEQNSDLKGSKRTQRIRKQLQEEYRIEMKKNRTVYVFEGGVAKAVQTTS
jgi:hypothetical protein